MHVSYQARALREASFEWSSSLPKMSGRLQKKCPHCQEDNPIRCKKCKYCNHDMKKKVGRPKGSTRSAGFKVGTSGGRPRSTTVGEGYLVSKEGGRPRKASGKPTGSSEVLGNRKGLRACGRPIGSTEANGSGVGKSGGRPTGSTQANGFDSSKAGGRPTGSTGLKGYNIGLSGGVYASAQSNALFKDDVELPHEWDSSVGTINVNDCLLRTCRSRIVQQRAFDSQPLAIGLCYSCGRILWNPSHAHYSGLVTPPNGMTANDAPATAYLKATPNSNLTFVRNKGDCEKWLSCPQCKKYD